MRRRFGSWGIIITAAIAMSGSVAAASAASPHHHPTGTTSAAVSPPQWSRGPTAELANDNQLDGISCGSTSSCVAINGSAFDDNGGTWSGPVDLDPSSHQLGGAAASAVSCVDPQFCMALGTDRNSPTMFDYDGTGWRATVLPSTVGLEEVPESNAGLSCVSDTFCLAVSRTGFTATYDGQRWGPAPSPPFTSTAISVSCGSITFCVAVGNEESSTFDGAQWSAPVDAPDLGAISCTGTTCVASNLSAPATTYRFSGGAWTVLASVGEAVVALSCTSTDFCIAVGTVPSTHANVASSFNGSSWSSVVGLGATAPTGVSCPDSQLCQISDDSGDVFTIVTADPAAPTFVKVARVQSAPLAVACASATFCEAIDQRGKAINWNGTRWSAPTRTGAYHLRAISCPAASLCMTIDARGRATTLRDHVWQPRQKILGPSQGNQISCPTKRFCVAVQAGGNRERSRAAVWDGKNWSTATTFDQHAVVTSFDCAAAGRCLALDGSRWLSYRNGRWSKPKSFVSADHYAASVSCLTANRCIAGVSNNRGPGFKTYLFTGARWHALARRFSDFNAMSCGSKAGCVAVDQEGDTTAFDGRRWSSSTGLPGAGTNPLPDDVRLTALSCWSARGCLDVSTLGQYGDTFLTHP